MKKLSDHQTTIQKLEGMLSNMNASLERLKLEHESMIAKVGFMKLQLSKAREMNMELYDDEEFMKNEYKAIFKD